MKRSLVLLAAFACAGPQRTVSLAKDCGELAAWAQAKAGDERPRGGETSALEDAHEAAACFHRKGDDAKARAALGLALSLQAAARAGEAAGPKAGSFDDGLARSLAALALSAKAAGEQTTFAAAAEALRSIQEGEALLADGGDRTAAGEAVSMVDGSCFFCARAEVYGAQDREHVELLGSFAGVPYVRRDDGREQFLLATRLLASGEESPRQKFAEAMRRRARVIDDATPALLARRTPAQGEERALDAPLYRVSLRGFAFGAIDGDVKLPVHSDEGEIIVRFPCKLLQRAGRDRRFVAPPDGVDAVVRYEGSDGKRPIYRTVILRHEDGVAEGP